MHLRAQVDAVFEPKLLNMMLILKLPNTSQSFIVIGPTLIHSLYTGFSKSRLYRRRAKQIDICISSLDSPL